MVNISSQVEKNNEIFSRFPQDSCPIIIGYWSWFKYQKWYWEGDRPQKDFLIWVKNTWLFHAKNLNLNPLDYSSLIKLFWTDFAEYIQNISPYIYYNPYVKVWDDTIKYGIISTEKMISDLLNWETLYIAGRLHKPVEVFRTTDKFNEAFEINLSYALKVALILLGENFTEQELYETITWISYMWDSRKWYFENPQKVQNIVKWNFKEFQELYKNTIQKNTEIEKKWSNTDNFNQDKNPIKIEQIHQKWYLPDNLLKWIPDWVTDFDILEKFIISRINDIVKSSSFEQTIKWFITAWFSKSLHYIFEKNKKSRKR